MHSPNGLLFYLRAQDFLVSTEARADTPGCSAAGAIPAALPARLVFGWGAQSYDDTWAQTSGTKWDVEWTYLSGQAGNNWYNSWGYGSADGSFADTLFQTIDAAGFIPGIHLYNMGYGHDQGDSGLVTEIQDSTWTKEYFAEFKVLMQKAKTFGKPVIIVLEGDAFGMVEMLVNNQPNTTAAVASTGMPELASLPNTIAGFGQAFLAIRKSVGATNVVMGPDTPYYASGGDIMNWPPTDTSPLQSYVTYQWSFFSALGVGPNATGAQFDFSASCPRSADQDAFGDGRDLWTANDSDSVNSPSVNRYIQWLHLYNQASGVRWMLHQVPIGNSQHLDVPWDASQSRSGYKDVLVEYLFQVESPASTTIRDRHLANFANAGVVGMLLGFSDDGDMPTNDLWKDNKPFLNTHLPLVANAGGFAITSSCSGSTSGGSTSGGLTSGGSTGGGSTSSSSGTTSSSGGYGSSSSGPRGVSSGSSGTGTGSSGTGYASSGSVGASSGTLEGNTTTNDGKGNGGGCALATAPSSGRTSIALLAMVGLFAVRRRSAGVPRRTSEGARRDR